MNVQCKIILRFSKVAIKANYKGLVHPQTYLFRREHTYYYKYIHMYIHLITSVYLAFSCLE